MWPRGGCGRRCPGTRRLRSKKVELRPQLFSGGGVESRREWSVRIIALKLLEELKLSRTQPESLHANLIP